MNRRLLLLACLALWMTLASTRAHAQNPVSPPTRQISTSGESTVFVAPDEAVVTLGVQSVDADLQRATKSNEESSASLLKAIKSLGIEDKHISTDNLQVEIRYQNNGITVEGYTVRRLYMITLKDTKKLEQFVSLSLRSGANVLQGVEFRSSDLRKHRDQARSMAIKAAKEKAVALAKELDCSVGKPITISEGGSGYWGPMQRMGNSWAQNGFQSVPGGGEASGETLPLGQIAISAGVAVTFELVPN